MIVVSEAFEGQRLLAQQRSVHKALGEAVAGMHGLVLVTKTPAQWAEMQQ